MKRLLFFICLMTVSQNYLYACETKTLDKYAPSVLLVELVDKDHKNLNKNNLVKYEKMQDDYSDQEVLRKIAKHKKLNKFCHLYSPKMMALKEKETLIVESLKIDKQQVSIKFKNHLSLNCENVSDLGDLSEVLSPYLSFSCRKVSLLENLTPPTRLPASVQVVK